MSMTERDKTAGDEPLIADVMVTDVVTVSPEMGVKELAELLRDKGIGGAPVVNEKGELMGIVTEGDLMSLDADLHFPHYIQFLDSVIYLESTKKFEERLKKAVAATVRDIMTPDVHTVRPDDLVRKAATLMADHGFDRVPVEEGGKIVGIVGRHEVLKALGL
jgi:CBS domain-containing protein